VCDVYGKRRTDGSTTTTTKIAAPPPSTTTTKSPKNQPSQGKTDPPMLKKKSLSDRGPSRQTAIVPPHSNYLILFLIFVPTLTF